MKNKDKYNLDDLKISMCLDKDLISYLNVKYNNELVYYTRSRVSAKCVMLLLNWLESESVDEEQR